MGGNYKLIITICNYIHDNDIQIQLLNWQVSRLGTLLGKLGAEKFWVGPGETLEGFI